MSKHLLACLTALAGSLPIASRGSAQPARVINDVSVTEPSGATALATFTVSYTDGQPHRNTIIIVSTASGQPLGPSVATSGTSCSGNVDFVNINGLAFTFSGAQQSFSVTVCGDSHDEADQEFFVNLTARGVAVQDGQGIGTIIDDDPTPVFSVGDSRGDEGAAGVATSGSFTLIFSTGKKVQQIRVPICADGSANEPNETFSVTLARATSARSLQATGTATVQ